MKHPSMLKTIRQLTKDFLDQQTSGQTGLVESYDGSSRYSYNAQKGQFEIGTAEYLQNQCFVYDGALAVLAYSVLGEFDSAQRLLINFNHNFHIAKGDQIGLLNSYRTDTFADPGRQLAMGIDGDRMHAGPNIWVGMAAFHYTLLSGDIQFFSLFLEIIKWAIHRIPHDTLANRRRAGISMGSGWGPNWQSIFSTEHNIDYFAILNMLTATFHDPKYQELIDSSALRFDALCEEQSAVLSWLVEKVYDPSEGRFNVGINELGVDRVRALDTTTFAILGIGPACLQANGIDPDKLVRNTEKHLKVTIDVASEKVAGYDFTDSEGSGQKRDPLIWIEGTCQMILSYRQMSEFHASKDDATSGSSWSQMADQLTSETERLIRLLSSNQAIPSYTSAKPRPMETVKTFKDDWEIQRTDSEETVKSVASAVWRLLAAENFNPMSSDASRKATKSRD